MVGPKNEKDNSRGVRYHAKEVLHTTTMAWEWQFEKVETSLGTTRMILVRMMVAKVVDDGRLDEILRAVVMQPGTPGWNCVGWVKDALEALERDGRALGTRVIQWDKVRNTAMEFCTRKETEDRFKLTTSNNPKKYDLSKVPTYNLLDRKEVVP